MTEIDDESLPLPPMTAELYAQIKEAASCFGYKIGCSRESWGERYYIVLPSNKYLQVQLDPEIVRLVWAAAALKMEVLQNQIEQLKIMRPIRYKDRPPGFVEERKKICTTPQVCFEFGDSAPVCGLCDRLACEALGGIIDSK